MKAVNRISIMSFVLATLYVSSGFAAAQELIFSSQPIAQTMTTDSSQVLMYTIYNSGNQPVKLNNIDVGPHDNPKYWAATNDCSGLVAPDQSCHIRLTIHAPANSGFMNTALIINYGESNTELRSRPIQFDVLAVPVAMSTTPTNKINKTTAASKSATTKTKTVTTASQPTMKSSNKTAVQSTTATSQTTPGVIVVSSQSNAMIPLKDAQAAYNTSGAQINVYAGWSNINASKSNIVFNQYETDSLVGSDHSTTFIPGVGVSYDFVLNPNGGIIHGVGLGVDFFNDNFERTGQVYQYQLPQFNNYRYKADMNSARLLLNGEVDLHPLWHGLTFFAEGGVGGAYNRIQYSETAEPGISGGELDMPSNLRLNFAYDVGGGVKLPIGSNLELSFRYLYTDPGDAETGTVSNNNITLQKPIKFDMQSNSWLFGLSYLIR
jgi:opacity protein-like surface antigen